MLVDYFDTNICEVYYYVDILYVVVYFSNFVVKNTRLEIGFYFKNRI